MMLKRQIFLKTAIAILAGVAFMIGCKKDTYVPIHAVCPLVISTNPANAAVGVALNPVIQITFNEAMNPTTITSSSVTLKGTSFVAGTITYGGQTAYFTPNSALADNTTYTGRVTTAVKDTYGNALQTDYVWTFSTGESLAPVVIETDPANGMTGVPLNKQVTATFNMAMDPQTINATSFTLKHGTTAVAGVLGYNGTSYSLTPSGLLLPNTLYTATITTGVKNTNNTPMANNYIWSFTTGTLSAPTVLSTDPANNATAVVMNKVVSVDFSEAMNPVSINATSFTLKQGSTIISAVVSYNGTSAYLNPINDLLPNTVYTGMITTGAKNLAGVSLANNYSWTFTTGNVIAPIVQSTDPVNNATGVVLNKMVTATFSIAMDPLTLTGANMMVKQGATPIAGTVSHTSTSITFSSTTPYASNTTYTATITTGVKNVSGIPLANNYTWTFTTGLIVAPTIISTDPINGATGVGLNKIIKASFSMAMDPLTLTGSSFMVKLGSSSIAGIISYTGTTVSFTPASNLLSGSTYTATITTGAKNLAGVPLSANYSWTFSTNPSIGPDPVDLGSAANFGIIAGVGISNQAGQSEIHDLDVGIYPGVHSSITGFPPGLVINGSIYASDDINPPGVAAMLLQAKTDLTSAYLFAEGASSPAPVTVSGDQGGLTLAPGIYKSTSTLLIQSGNLTLDAQGDVNAFWIFQIASDFTTVGGAGGNVVLAGGAQAKNVFWQVGSSATIGNYTSFQGNVLALTSITMNSHATAVGRMLARNGAVVLSSTNLIIKP